MSMELGSVYIVQTADGQCIKIGFTTRLVRLRLEELVHSAFSRDHCGLRVLGFFPASYAVETELHRLFAPFRLNGDWYQSAPVLDYFAKSLTVPISNIDRPPCVMTATEFQRLGGKARAAKFTPEQRSQQARAAVRARWDKRSRKNAA
jgi:T5orf172 domain